MKEVSWLGGRTFASLLYLFLLGRNLFLLVDALLVVDASLGVLLVLGDKILHVLATGKR